MHPDLALFFSISFSQNKTQHQQSGVISGAMLPIRRAFQLSDWQQEVVVSSTVLAAFFSSLAGGPINHNYGRRYSILCAAIIFVTGSFVLLVAWNYYTLVAGRIIVGIG